MDSKQVDILREELYMSKFRNELEFIKNEDLDIASDRREYLEKILEQNDGTNKTETTKKSGYQQLIDDMQQGMFKKPWNRLPDIHKRIKFEEFIKQKTSNTDLQQKLSQQFEERLLQGHDKTAKSVSYLADEEKIVSVKDLVSDDEEEYKFVIPKKKMTRKPSKHFSKKKKPISKK